MKHRLYHSDRRSRNSFPHKQPTSSRRMTPLSDRTGSLSCGSRGGRREKPSWKCLVTPERPRTEVASSAFLVISPGWSQTYSPTMGGSVLRPGERHILGPTLGHFMQQQKTNSNTELGECQARDSEAPAAIP